MKPRALISIHDVRPATLADVAATLQALADAGVPRVALLVVPGAPWSEDAVASLRDLVAAGHELIAHGWQPEEVSRRPLQRLHASLVSRSAAEHLAVPRASIVQRMRRSHDWFSQQSLPEPRTYIPPAWALGGIPRQDMPSLPYTSLETLRGVRVRDSAGQYPLTPLPLLTFAAGTGVGPRFLADWNRLQLRQARRQGSLPRIALNPADHRSPLADQLRAVLALGWTAVSYDSLPGLLSVPHSRASA